MNIELQYPIKRDRRYTVTLEYAGHAKPVWVARFDRDKFIGSSISRSSAYMLALGHHARMNGALVIEAQV